MNLKEAFRFQNKLQGLMNEAQSILQDNRNITKTQTTIFHKKVMPELENEVTVDMAPSEYADRINEIMSFLLYLLDEHEISTEEPFDLRFDEHISAQFQITRPARNRVHLQTKVFEDGVHSFTEDIFETVHDRETVLALLEKAGFALHACAHRLLEDSPEVATWYVIARKPGE